MVFDGYSTPGTERDTVLSVDDLLRQMDDAEIAKAVIAPEDRELVVDNLAGNDRILTAASRHSDRLIPSCGINPWYKAKALEELKRCVSQGARMLVLAPALQGFIPTDELADDLLDCSATYQLPVYFHTGPHSSGGPTQVAIVAERHSSTNVVVGHCGATDHAWDMTTILKNHRLRNLWFELSLVRPWVVPAYIELAGSSRFIWASSSPRNCPKFELEQLGQLLPLDQYPDVFGGNLSQILHIKP
jgi:hypothetical protein